MYMLVLVLSLECQYVVHCNVSAVLPCVEQHGDARSPCCSSWALQPLCCVLTSMTCGFSYCTVVRQLATPTVYNIELALCRNSVHTIQLVLQAV